MVPLSSRESLGFLCHLQLSISGYLPDECSTFCISIIVGVSISAGKWPGKICALFQLALYAPNGVVMKLKYLTISVNLVWLRNVGF